MSHPQVHPTAVIDEDVQIGAGTRVWHFVHIGPHARIGSDCTLGQNVFVAEAVRIGDGVRIQNNVSIYQGVEIEDQVFLGPSCVFTNVSTPRAFVSRRDQFATTRVAHGASIGANATIVCGSDIGAYALVGAGAVVTRSVPAHGLMVGNPARRMGWVCRCGLRLPDGARPVCEGCREEHVIEGELCRREAPSDVPERGAQREPGSVDTFNASIDMVDLAAQNGPLMPELRAVFERVAGHGQFILGDEVAALEGDLAAYLGLRHAVAVSSGTDALLMALMALGVGVGDEVITTAFSFAATAMCIARLGARPVFVDIDAATFNLDPAAAEAAIGPRTRAILPVHLFGQPCAPEALADIAARHDLPIIEDAAQAIGARSTRGPVGALGKLACFSFFPPRIWAPSVTPAW
ncbi:MAG: aminotransferase class I/II-fold pyridoxal phosphate-dependent enzyme [Polyangiaceae bacterium]